MNSSGHIKNDGHLAAHKNDGHLAAHNGHSHHISPLVGEHKGHEATHAIMAQILLFSLIGSQIFLYAWRKTHPSSYALATTLALWVVPVGFALYHSNWQFLVFHILFSLPNISILVSITQSFRVSPNTPRRVYQFYSAIYTLCYTIGVFGITRLSNNRLRCRDIKLLSSSGTDGVK
jgi:hypothetical protein